MLLETFRFKDEEDYVNEIWLKGAVSPPNSAKLGNYKMPVKLRET